MQITKVIKRLPQSVNIHLKSVKFLLITFVELSIFWRVLVALTVKTDTKYGEWFYLFICFFFFPAASKVCWKRLCNVPDGCKTSCPCFSSAVKGGMMGFLEPGLFQDLGLMLSALAFILCSSCLWSFGRSLGLPVLPPSSCRWMWPVWLSQKTFIWQNYCNLSI